MKKFLTVFIVGTLFSTSSAWSTQGCKTEDPFPYTSPYNIGLCPEDIQSWMDRANACTHFSGEDAGDEERKSELAEKMAELKCEVLHCDYDDLFTKYEGDIALIGTLTGYVEVLYGGTDAIKCEKQQ